jgi:hypothetical protein
MTGQTVVGLHKNAASSGKFVIVRIASSQNAGFPQIPSTVVGTSSVALESGAVDAITGSD